MCIGRQSVQWKVSFSLYNMNVTLVIEVPLEEHAQLQPTLLQYDLKYSYYLCDSKCLHFSFIELLNRGSIGSMDTFASVKTLHLRSRHTLLVFPDKVNPKTAAPWLEYIQNESGVMCGQWVNTWGPCLEWIQVILSVTFFSLRPSPTLLHKYTHTRTDSSYVLPVLLHCLFTVGESITLISMWRFCLKYFAPAFPDNNSVIEAKLNNWEWPQRYLFKNTNRH